MRNLIKEKIKSPKDIGYAISRLWLDKAKKKRLLSKQYSFTNRSKGSNNLLLIIAGFQEYYWDAVFERVQRNITQFDESIDVCICVPVGGAQASRLDDYAEQYQWSILRIQRDLLAQVQNTAIDLHTKAKWIYKIDEDIILCDHYFSKMKRTYLKYSSDPSNYMIVGFVAPLLNVNAYGSIRFLSTINSFLEFIEKYGSYNLGDDWRKATIHSNPDAAVYLWSKSIPFDEISKRVEELNKDKISICPHRFSIGAILFTRQYWTQIGSFEVAFEASMGVEERQLCQACMDDMHAIVVGEDTFVGHLGFGAQKNAIHKFYDMNESDIRLK